MSNEDLAAWAVKHLVRACTARIDGEYLLNDG
jgi:hypothetical protein